MYKMTKYCFVLIWLIFRSVFVLGETLSVAQFYRYAGHQQRDFVYRFVQFSLWKYSLVMDK